MKTAIVFYSKHHGNTKKLLDEMSSKAKTAAIFDATDKIYTAAKKLIK